MASEVERLRRNLRSLRATWRAFRCDTGGATALEYGLIVAVMAVATVGMMTAFGTALGRAFETIAASLPFDAVE